MMDTLRILFVDDETVIVDSARKILESPGLKLLTAPDAEAASAILATQPVDILISDLVLPGVSGMKLMETALDQDPGLVIVITTGYSTVENAVAALKRGAFDFLPKPFTCDELSSCVARARRAVELRLPLKASTERRFGGFRLGQQTWARPERDGTAVLGITGLALETLEAIQTVDLPEVGANLRQGGRMVALLTGDGLSHTLWSPLGGRVLSVQDWLRDGLEARRNDPEGGGWLVRIRPADLEGELSNLAGS